MAAFENTERWDPGVAEAARLTDGPVALGTRFLVVATFLGRRLPLPYEVTTFEPSRRLVVTAETSSIRSVDEIRIEAGATGAIVSYDAALVLRGTSRVASPVLPLAFKRIGDRARDGLRRELNPT